MPKYYRRVLADRAIDEASNTSHDIQHIEMMLASTVDGDKRVLLQNLVKSLRHLRDKRKQASNLGVYAAIINIALFSPIIIWAFITNNIEWLTTPLVFIPLVVIDGLMFFILKKILKSLNIKSQDKAQHEVASLQKILYASPAQTQNT